MRALALDHRVPMDSGGWRPIAIDFAPAALAACPDCGRHHEIDGSRIAADGAVSGDLACQCGFAAPVRLDGWKAAGS